MYTVYVLYSASHNKIYIGYTANIENRLLAHNHPNNNGWTKSFQPWKMIYSEEFETKSESLKREKQLKSAKGRNFIWQTLIS